MATGGDTRGRVHTAAAAAAGGGGVVEQLAASQAQGRDAGAAWNRSTFNAIPRGPLPLFSELSLASSLLDAPAK